MFVSNILYLIFSNHSLNEVIDDVFLVSPNAVIVESSSLGFEAVPRRGELEGARDSECMRLP